jgi:hypothetical protein
MKNEFEPCIQDVKPNSWQHCHQLQSIAQLAAGSCFAPTSTAGSVYSCCTQQLYLERVNKWGAAHITLNGHPVDGISAAKVVLEVQGGRSAFWTLVRNCSQHETPWSRMSSTCVLVLVCIFLGIFVLQYRSRRQRARRLQAGTGAAVQAWLESLLCSHREHTALPGVSCRPDGCPCIDKSGHLSDGGSSSGVRQLSKIQRIFRKMSMYAGPSALRQT